MTGFAIGLIMILSVGGLNRDFFGFGIFLKPLFIGPDVSLVLGLPGPRFGFGGSLLCVSIKKI